MADACTLDEVWGVGDAALRRLVRRISRFELALALSGTPEAIQRRVLTALTDGSAPMVAQTLTRLGRPPEVLVEASRRRIRAIAQRLDSPAPGDATPPAAP